MSLLLARMDVPELKQTMVAIGCPTQARLAARIGGEPERCQPVDQARRTAPHCDASAPVGCGSRMMGAVIDLVTESTVDGAWNAYTEYARLLSEDHSKLTDRAFHEEFTRRYERWRKLFMMQESR